MVEKGVQESPAPLKKFLLGFRATVTAFTLAAFAIFNSFGGTAADARHAMGAGLAPDRFALLKLNVV